MATWRRCPKSPFYQRPSMIKRWDQRKNKFDKAYVDPMELVMVHTIPGDATVDVLRWQVEVLDENSSGTFDEFGPQEAAMLLAWIERVVDAIDGDDGSISKGRQEALLGDLDVDAEARDRLLGALERFIFGSPPEATEFLQQKVPQNDEALGGILFHYGVGPC